MKPNSLTSRITLLLSIATLFLLGGAALTMDQLVDHRVTGYMDTALLDQAKTLASLIESGSQSIAKQQSDKTLQLVQSSYWAIRCDGGATVNSQHTPPVYPDTWLATAQIKPNFSNLTAGHHVLRAVWFRFTGTGNSRGSSNQTPGSSTSCAMLFMHSRDAMDAVLLAIDVVLLSVPFLAFLAVLIISPLLVKHGIKPLSLLGEAMRGIGPQDPSQRLQPAGPRELEPLVARFNDVLERMEDGVARERQFAGALAHETRTHLAELRSLVEVEERYPSKRSVQDTLGEVGSIVSELQGTVSALLLLTRLEAGIESVALDNVSIKGALERQLELSANSLKARTLKLNWLTDTTDRMLIVDRTLLDIIIGNLLSNAVAYAPESGCINIQLTQHSLTLSNDAPDLDKCDVARFGQRFWSKHHNTNGHVGLGLALATAASSAINLQLSFMLDTDKCLSARLSWSDDSQVI